MYYSSRQSPRKIASHLQDYYTDLGFDYRGKIFSKTISNIILKNKVNRAILSRFESIIVMLIDSVKQVRLHYTISLDKNDRNIN